MDHWEYKIEVIKEVADLVGGTSKNKYLHEVLNQLGREGWELVSVSVQYHSHQSGSVTSYNYTYHTCYLKRRLSEPTEPER